MGIARRSSAVPGTSQSIYDDLRIVRSRGGFALARPEDLAGTLDLAPFQAVGSPLDFDQARSELRSFVERWIKLVRESSETHHGPALASESLETLLFSDSKPRDYASVRLDIGRVAERDADFIRAEENKILVACARAFWKAYSDPMTGLSLRTSYEDNFKLNKLLEASLSIKTCLLDFALECSRSVGSAVTVPVLSAMLDLVRELFYLLGSYEVTREEASLNLPPVWQWSVKHLEVQLWPSILDSPPHPAMRDMRVEFAELCRRSQAKSEAPISEFVDDLCHAVAEHYSKYCGMLRARVVVPQECDLIKNYVAAKAMADIWLWIYDHGFASQPPPLTHWANNEIVYI